MATKTKNKLSKALKNTFLNELKGKKEEERLERAKLNANLREIIVYTNKNDKNSTNIIDFLIKEGINLTQKEISENKEAWSITASTTNINAIPTFYVNGEYLVNGRDFQNPQHCLNALKYLGSPDFINPSYEDKMLEHSKTNQYNIFNKINQLEQKINPLVQFITNLQKELEEEEGE